VGIASEVEDKTNTAIAAAAAQVRESGFAILSASALLEIGSSHHWVAADEAQFRASWNDLPPDEFLADGGKYRFRRHASLRLNYASEPAWENVPYRPHWQPKSYNKLHGGVFRTFGEVKPETTANAVYRALVSGLGLTFNGVTTASPKSWFVETHQFRIDARSGEGRPTPEGAHRDGVDFVALVMMGRRDIEGAVTTIFDNERTLLAEFMLHEPWTAMLLDDNRVVHATTPFKASGTNPERDTLVVTYRSNGFLEP
jgi:hypothetical protein